MPTIRVRVCFWFHLLKCKQFIFITHLCAVDKTEHLRTSPWPLGNSDFPFFIFWHFMDQTASRLLKKWLTDAHLVFQPSLLLTFPMLKFRFSSSTNSMKRQKTVSQYFSTLLSTPTSSLILKKFYFLEGLNKSLTQLGTVTQKGVNSVCVLGTIFSCTLIHM